MMAAPVGDDVYEAFTVLQDFICAGLSGENCAMRLPRSDQFVALLSPVNAGENSILSVRHICSFEASGAAVLGVFNHQPMTRLPTAWIKWR